MLGSSSANGAPRLMASIVCPPAACLAGPATRAGQAATQCSQDLLRVAAPDGAPFGRVRHDSQQGSGACRQTRGGPARCRAGEQDACGVRDKTAHAPAQCKVASKAANDVNAKPCAGDAPVRTRQDPSRTAAREPRGKRSRRIAICAPLRAELNGLRRRNDRISEETERDQTRPMLPASLHTVDAAPAIYASRATRQQAQDARSLGLGWEGLRWPD